MSTLFEYSLVIVIYTSVQIKLVLEARTASTFDDNPQAAAFFRNLLQALYATLADDDLIFAGIAGNFG